MERIVIYEQTHYPGSKIKLNQGDRFTGELIKKLNRLQPGIYKFKVIPYKCESHCCIDSRGLSWKADITAVEISKNNKMVSVLATYNIELYIARGIIINVDIEKDLFN